MGGGVAEEKKKMRKKLSFIFFNTHTTETFTDNENIFGCISHIRSIVLVNSCTLLQQQSSKRINPHQLKIVLIIAAGGKSVWVTSYRYTQTFTSLRIKHEAFLLHA